MCTQYVFAALVISDVARAHGGLFINKEPKTYASVCSTVHRASCLLPSDCFVQDRPSCAHVTGNARFIRSPSSSHWCIGIILVHLHDEEWTAHLSTAKKFDVWGVRINYNLILQLELGLARILILSYLIYMTIERVVCVWVITRQLLHEITRN